MATTTPQPSSVVTKAGRDMEELFDGFFGSIETLRQNNTAAEHQNVNATISSISSNLWSPKTERIEYSNHIQILAHLPHVPSNQIHINVDTPGHLKIYCECSLKASYDCGSDRISERQLGQFEKDIPLPLTAQVDQMSVICKDADVIITIPK
ncbi:hypothetical protein IWW36_002649 [Coemansia brasiliensis]|uniref:SHSP domain-containing protein n=1 Tax=Coemansia brasiliensis TaxID=2650707 RepID=A0A9W8M0U0_9FUNG|nr:hypothetical protein IWW36_002649 [Coemansia brasiliensis]